MLTWKFRQGMSTLWSLNLARPQWAALWSQRRWQTWRAVLKWRERRRPLKFYNELHREYVCTVYTAAKYGWTCRQLNAGNNINAHVCIEDVADYQGWFFSYLWWSLWTPSRTPTHASCVYWHLCVNVTHTHVSDKTGRAELVKWFYIMLQRYMEQFYNTASTWMVIVPPVDPAGFSKNQWCTDLLIVLQITVDLQQTDTHVHTQPVSSRTAL